MNYRSSIKFNGKEGALMKTVLNKISWKTLFIMLGFLIAIRLLLEFN